MQVDQIPRVLDTSTGDCREPIEEMGERGGEAVTTDESAVVAKPLLDAMVVEDGQGDGCLPDPTSTDESKWGEVFCKVDDLVDQIVTPEKGSWWPGRRFTGYGRFKYKTLGSSVV